MSYSAMAWAMEQKLQCSEKMVLLALANYADQDASCYPSQSRLSKDCGLTRQSISRIVGELERKGLISFHERSRQDGSNTSCRYLLNVPSQFMVTRDDTRAAKKLSVYVVAGNGLVKVGISANVDERVAGLERSGGFGITVVRAWELEAKDARVVERATHEGLAAHSVKGEWFNVEPAVAVEAVLSSMETCLSNGLTGVSEPNGTPCKTALHHEPVIETPKIPSSVRATKLPSEEKLAFEAFNELADEIGLSRAQALTDERRTKIRQRLSECGGLTGWLDAMGKIRGSPFLKGDNDRGWKANLDFVLQRSSFTRLMEGTYDRAPAQSRTPSSGQQSSNADSFAKLDAVFDEAIRRSDGCRKESREEDHFGLP